MRQGGSQLERSRLAHSVKRLARSFSKISDKSENLDMIYYKLLLTSLLRI